MTDRKEWVTRTPVQRCAGFTLIEILVVMSIILVLAVMIVPGLAGSRYMAKKAAARTEIANLETALSMYEADFGAYPEDDDDSSKPLVEALGGKTEEGKPPKKTYYPFKKSRINEGDGKYYSEFKKPFCYRENASEEDKEGKEMENKDSFDIWTDNGKGDDKGINNWD
ncbi:MAG: prepilin-type N-terminal cleavage/methylation domain-containing protein [Planctomycetes bacterium]|nr:prepilin-type N-terminal cleavage/methylation domain-containing protein [Planctomycetota bacterium]